MKTPLDWLTDPVLVPNAGTAERARRRQESLTKPPGSLGRLEDLAIWFAGRQGGVRPAMTEAQLAAACRAGLDAVERARAAEAQLFVGAEMGHRQHHGGVSLGLRPYPCCAWPANSARNFEKVWPE